MRLKKSFCGFESHLPHVFLTLLNQCWLSITHPMEVSMSKFNKKRSPFTQGIIAGKNTPTAGRYSNFELLRRVTLANLLFESNYYQSSDSIMKQIEELVPKVPPEDVVSLAIECRFEQKLRHTPLWLLLLVHEYHQYPIRVPLAKIATRPDMLMDILAMHKTRKGQLKPIPQSLKKGLAMAFNNYDQYQIAKYKKSKLDLSLVDVVNLVHPRPTEKNAHALKLLVDGVLPAPNTWEVALSQGESKKSTFIRMIEERSLGSLAILRNLKNMQEAYINRRQIQNAISQVKSSWLTPLNFLAAQRAAPQHTHDLNQAMKRCFADTQIPGTTILAIDVSGSMGLLTSQTSGFSRMDLAFAMAALGSYIFEDLMLVFTAGDDSSRKGKHVVWSNNKGLGIVHDYKGLFDSLGGGGIFTHQLTKWLIDKGYAKDADRLVVISDSQDIDVHYGSKNLPDTSPYKYSYIIDISTHTHGIKTSVWTAEINGWSDKLFHYIAAIENIQSE